MSLAPTRELFFSDTFAAQRLSYDVLGLCLRRFPQLRPVMPFAAVSFDILEHLDPKSFGAQAPSPLHRLEFLLLFAFSPRLHQQGKLAAHSGLVPAQPPLTQ